LIIILIKIPFTKEIVHITIQKRFLFDGKLYQRLVGGKIMSMAAGKMKLRVFNEMKIISSIFLARLLVQDKKLSRRNKIIIINKVLV
jgi:hypothetical protein